MLVSILWFITFFVDALFIASLFERRTVLCSFAPGVLLVLALDCVLYGFMSVFGVSVYLAQVVVAQAILFFGLSFIMKTRFNDIKKRLFDSTDIAVLLILAIVVFLCASKQFGPTLQIHYTAPDPSRHIFETWKIVNDGMVSGQFAWWSLTAMLSQALSGLSIDVPLYKVFIATDIMSLYFSGWLLYAIIKNRETRATRFIGVLIPALYLVAFPLSVMVYGFCYLGAGVNFCALILFSIRASGCKVGRYIASSLGALGLVTSYSLFAPPVYLALFVYVAHSEWRETHSITRLVLTEVSLFAIPVLIGFFIVFLGIFSNLSVSDALATEGGIYKNLFTDFIFCAPFALLGFCTACKKKEDGFPVVLSAVLLGYAGIALVLGISGYISSYYFYKMHFILWLVFFVFAAKGLYRIAEFEATAVICTCFPWAIVALLCFSGFDAAVSRVSPVFNPSSGSDALMPLTANNRVQVAFSRSYSSEKIEVFSRFDRLLQEEGNPWFQVLGTYVDIYWFEPIAGRYATDSYYWNLQDDELEGRYEECDYILMMNEPDPAEDGGSLTTLSGSSPYRILENHLSNFEVIYENAAGKILKKV